MLVDLCPECNRPRKAGRCSRCDPETEPKRTLIATQRAESRYVGSPANPVYVAELMACLRLRFAGAITQNDLEGACENAESRARHVETAKTKKLWKEPAGGNPAAEIIARLAGTFGRVERDANDRPISPPEPAGLF